MSETIINCFDSHTHFLATGQVAVELSLRELKSANDVDQLQILPQHCRGDWIVGFGWNHNNWSPSVLPTKEILDRVFPDQPVFFSRVDGHASWVNSKALELLNYDSNSNGILLEQDHIKALMQLPEYTDEQIQQFLLTAGNTFNAGGFTHVRDMSMTYRQWQIQKNLCENEKLNIYCEGFITVESVKDLPRGLEEYQKCFADVCSQLKIKGLKIFIDGSLGSKTAYLAKNYVNENHRGQLLWSATDIKSAIAFCWRNKIEIAIHCIGDEAVHIAATCAREVSAAGMLGKIHLEHVQLIRPETIPILKPLHVYVHMQPSHWLSDHTWLAHTIGEQSQLLFQWEALRKNRIYVDFGSDSPIEVISLLRTHAALVESAKQGIPALTENWKRFHSYPTSGWGNGETVFDEQGIISVKLDGKTLINFR